MPALLTRTSSLSEQPTSSLRKSDVIKVDCDEQRHWHFFLSVVIGINPTLGWNHDPIHVTVVRRIVNATSPGHDVHRVFVPTQEPIFAEVRNLLACVARDGIGE